MRSASPGQLAFTNWVPVPYTATPVAVAVAVWACNRMVAVRLVVSEVTRSSAPSPFRSASAAQLGAVPTL